MVLVISHFGFEGGTLGLVASVPCHCLSFTFHYFPVSSDQLAGNEYMHDSMDEFGIRLNWTNNNIGRCPRGSKYTLIDLLLGEWCLYVLSIVFDPILLIPADNEDTHKSMDVFEFRPDPTTDFGVSRH